MADSINLHSEVRFRTVKIEYVRTDWMLTAKNWLPREPRGAVSKAGSPALTVRGEVFERFQRLSTALS
jgi:hypothetical protein